MHLFKWNSVSLLKCSGGLGIRTMKDINQALLAKSGWRVFQDDSGIWCKILKHTYMNTKSLSDSELSKGVVCSSIWNVIKEHVLMDFLTGMLNQFVSDYLVDGQWLIDHLTVVLP